MSRRHWVAQHASNTPCEDAMVVSDAAPGTFAAVFDGHGGPEVALFAAAHLLQKFTGRYEPAAVPKVGGSSSGLEAIRAKFFQSGVAAAPPSSGPNDPAEQLAGAVLDCDRQWLKQHAAKQAGSRRLSRVGACALACYCEGDKMVVANAGDCRGVVGRRRPLNSDEVSYDAVAISRDHTADDERERRKVGRRTQDPRPLRSTVNSHVINYDLPLRVAGSLMVTRALGDAYLKVAALSTSPFAQYCPYITAEPEMYTHQISARDDFIILASDGIWDHLSNEEAVQLVGLHLQTVARPDDSTRKHARTHARTHSHVF